MNPEPPTDERERRKALMEKHDPGYIHVCYREDMWDWGEQPQAASREMQATGGFWSGFRRGYVLAHVVAAVAVVIWLALR